MTSTPTSLPETDDHGFELKSRRRWWWLALGVIVVVVAAVAVRWAFYSDNKSANEIAGATLYVGTQEGYVGEQALIEFVGREVAPRYGIKVAFRGLSDSNTINRAVSDGEIAATTFEHKLWLDQVLEANPDFKETATQPPIFRWAFGIYSSKYKHPLDVPDGSKIALIADPANESQGIWYLAKAGLVTLAPNAGSTALTEKDIADNPRHLKFILLDYGAVPRALPDVALVAGYTSDFISAGTPPEYLIFNPPPPDEFAGVLTIGSKYADTDNVKKLVAAFHDPAVQQFLRSDPAVKGSLLPFQGG